MKLAADVDIDLSATVPISNQQGDFTTELVLLVTNTGNLALFNVDVLIDLAKHFPDGFEFNGDITRDNQSMVLNAAFDGASDRSVSDADGDDGITSNLSVGDFVEVRIPLTFTPGDETNLNLDAQVVADSSDGLVSDDSSDDVDSGEDQATELSLLPVGMLGVAQSASPAREISPSANPSERCQLSPCVTQLVIAVKNVGNTDLEGLLVNQLLGGLNGLPDDTEVVIRALSTSGDVSGADQALVDQVFVIGVDDPIALLEQAIDLLAQIFG